MRAFLLYTHHMTTRIERNVHRIDFDKDNARIALLSDIHWDNPKCDRKLLKSHLNYCLKNKIKVFINGDFFCLMQGKYDPRRSKKDILPEHNKANYIDAVIVDAVNWWSPYAEILTVIGYGNHETAILRTWRPIHFRGLLICLITTTKLNCIPEDMEDG